MEKFPISAEKFDIEKSTLRDAYTLLGAKTPFDLSNKYTEAEQILFKNGTWDYSDPHQIQNQIKDILESVLEDTLGEEEKEWRNEILWFWYHHAISVAFYRKLDTPAAQAFAAKALALQPEDHPNMVTRLLFYIVHGNTVEAEKWVTTNKDCDEYQTMSELLEEYKAEKL